MGKKTNAESVAEYEARQKEKDPVAFRNKNIAKCKKYQQKKKRELKDLQRRAANPIASAVQQILESQREEREAELKALVEAHHQTEKRAFESTKSTGKLAFKSTAKSQKSVLKTHTTERTKTLKRLLGKLGAPRKEVVSPSALDVDAAENGSESPVDTKQRAVDDGSDSRRLFGRGGAYDDVKHRSKSPADTTERASEDGSVHRANTNRRLLGADESRAESNRRFCIPSRAIHVAREHAETPQSLTLCNSTPRSTTPRRLRLPSSEARRNEIYARQNFRHARVSGRNGFWKPNDRIILPLTWERRIISFNMGEDIVVTSMGLRLCHELIRDKLPVYEGDGLGVALAQVQNSLPEFLLEGLLDIWEGRQRLQHSNDRVYTFETRQELYEYINTVYWVLFELAPFWELRHENSAATQQMARAEEYLARAKQAEEQAKEAEQRVKEHKRFNFECARFQLGKQLESHYENPVTSLGSRRPRQIVDEEEEEARDDGCRAFKRRRKENFIYEARDDMCHAVKRRRKEKLD